METTATFQPLTEEEIARRKAIVFLKGYIIGYAVSNGFKWSNKREPSPVFTAGVEAGVRCYNITPVHVIYNMVKGHGRPHLGYPEADVGCYRSWHGCHNYQTLASLTKEATGYDLEELA